MRLKIIEDLFSGENENIERWRWLKEQSEELF